MMLGASVRAYVCAEPTDMRKSIDGLSQLVAPVFDADPFAGAVYVFFGKRRDKVKLLWWDRHGFWLAYKRLERGRFPHPEALADRGLALTELMAFLDGIDVSRVRVLAAVSASRVR
jgi:transposase